MDYLEFISLLVPRIVTAMTNVRDAVVAAGQVSSPVRLVTATGPTEVDSNDLRYQMSVSTGNGGNLRSVLVYVELTDATHLGQPNNPGHAILTLYAEQNGGAQVTTAYNAGIPLSYDDPAGLDALLVKLAELENALPEATAKIRNHLRI